MKLTRQQRINNTGTLMVNQARQMATDFRKVFESGLDWPEQDGHPPLKATAKEVMDALGDNAKELQIVVAYILDGKNNKIIK